MGILHNSGWMWYSSLQSGLGRLEWLIIRISAVDVWITRLGASQDRWAHASMKMLQYDIHLAADLALDLTANGLRWVNKFQVHMPHLTAPGVSIVFTAIDHVTVPYVISNFDALYYYRDWRGWMKDLEFESRMRHLLESAYSMFAGWHNVGILA